jgi:3-oxoacyl-[acyl-carrier-protein] synthase II
VTSGADPVWITGIGYHGAFGDAAETWEALHAGRSAVARVTPDGLWGTDPLAGAKAAPFSLAPWLPDRKVEKYMTATTRLAVLAAGRALEDAGVRANPDLCADTALFVATGSISFDLAEMLPLLEPAGDGAGGAAERFRRLSPLLPFRSLLNLPLGLVSIVYGLHGDSFVLYPDALQGAVCLDTAVRAVRTGRCSRVLVGGCVQHLGLLPLTTLANHGPLLGDPREAQPHAPEHRGLAPADVAAFVLLESRATALARGARPLAVLEAVECQGCPPAEPTSAWREDLLRRAPRRPDVLVATGCTGIAEDRTVQAATTVWDGRAVPDVSWDGRLGWAGPAALPAATALAALSLRRGGLPEGTGTPTPERVLVAYLDPAAGGATVGLGAAAPGEARP